MSKSARPDARQLSILERRELVDGNAVPPATPNAPSPGHEPRSRGDHWLSEGALRLPGFALAEAAALVEVIRGVSALAQPRRMTTAGGGTMSAAITNCGSFGWVSDAQGYRYSPVEPQTRSPWPAIPTLVLDVAQRAAAHALAVDFHPDSCVLNHYATGAGMGLHRDDNEKSHDHPIVSISLGCTARFLWGGVSKSDPVVEVPLKHGDVVVWGGPSRLRYHGVAPLAPGRHPLLDSWRWNLTLRRAGM